MAAALAGPALQMWKDNPEVDYADIWKYSKISLLTYLFLIVIVIVMVIFGVVLAVYAARDKQGQDVLPGINYTAAIAITIVLFVFALILGIGTALYRLWWIPQKVEKLRLNRGRKAVEQAIEMSAMSSKDQ